jgi:very-short-patch-repair endonuclease
LGPERATQLQQVHQWLLDRQLVGGRGLAGALTEQQLQQCSTAAREHHNIAAAEPPSALQQQVFTALQLTAAGVLSWQQEQLAVPDGACLIDIVGVTADGVRLAIEVDGPYHFVWPDRRLDGRTQHRNRVLAARGYAVVSVPYYEWNDLKGSRERQQYLLQLIEEALKHWKQRHPRHTPAASTTVALAAAQSLGTAQIGKAKHRQKRPRSSTAHAQQPTTAS